jgi:hypothetical protein
LVNELIEAKNKSELNRVTNRWTRYDLIVIAEMAYVAMPEAAAEMMFQIIAGTSGGDRDDELAVLRMDDDVSECEVVQGHARPVDRSGAHHRDRERIVSVSKNAGEKRRQQIKLSLCPRPTLRPKRVAFVRAQNDAEKIYKTNCVLCHAPDGSGSSPHASKNVLPAHGHSQNRSEKYGSGLPDDFSLFAAQLNRKLFVTNRAIVDARV